MPHTIKGVISLVLSVDTILMLSIAWLQKLNHGLSDVASLALAIAGVVVTYYTSLHIKAKWQGQQLDNEIKKIELLALKKKTENN
jgi:hypothetical protein